MLGILLLVLSCILAAQAEVFVDCECSGRAFSLSVQLADGRLAVFDDDRNGELSLEELQAHRVPLRRILEGLVQVQSGGRLLRPSVQPLGDGRGLLLIYGLPPRGEVLLQAGSEVCRGNVDDEPFVLAPGEHCQICRSEALETMMAIALLLFCPLLPGVLYLKGQGRPIRRTSA